MKIICETSLENFDAWSGARDTLDRIIEEGKCSELETILESEYPDGMTDTELNDLLWFESDLIYEWATKLLLTASVESGIYCQQMMQKYLAFLWSGLRVVQKSGGS